jgi:apolipoprotein N-acyltransferase
VSDETWGHVATNTCSPAERTRFHEWGQVVSDSLLVKTEREANAGARVISWSECSAMILKEDADSLVIRGRELAKRCNIYLAMAIGALDLGEGIRLENKVILIEPSGQVGWEYFKARPVPGYEAAVSVVRDGNLQVLSTPFGRLSAIICFDGSFPQVVAQAGKSGIDIILDPSNDGRAIDPWHTQMASFRSIEQGCNLVRTTYDGLTATYDCQGRCISSTDDFTLQSRAIVSEVPTKGASTVYATLGDWFAWVCLATLLVLGGKVLISILR